MSQRCILGDKPIPDRKLARHVYMSVPIFEEHTNVFDRTNTSLDRSDAVLTVELVELLPVYRYVICWLLMFFGLARRSGLRTAYALHTR